MPKNLSRNVKNLGTPENMFLSSSNQGASYVKGCTQPKNHNINRNGMKGGAQLGSSFDTSIPMGPAGARVGHKAYSGCGTKNPLNLGASSQIGGNYGAIEVGNARYGFNNTDALKNTPPGSFSYPPISTQNEKSCNMYGGKSKRSKKKRNKSKHSKKKRNNKKHSRKTRSERKHSKTHSKSKKKRSKKNKRKKRKSLKGGTGYHQFNSNVPHTNTYGLTNQGLLPSGKLASPIPIKVSNNCHDVYNHYTKTNYEAPARN